MSLNQPATALHTREETARTLRVSLATLDNWVRCGKGPSPTRLNRRVFFSASEIDRFVRDRTEREKMALCGGDLVTLIESELVERSPPQADGPFIRELSECLANLRTMDLIMRRGAFDEERARLFVRAVCVFSAKLLRLDETVHLQSLAADIVTAAILTALAKVPDILREGFESVT